ncbi:MAG: hypothetical protein ACOCW3_06420, partial [Spirochaetota bacterium]
MISRQATPARPVPRERRTEPPKSPPPGACGARGHAFALEPDEHLRETQDMASGPELQAIVDRLNRDNARAKADL